MDNERWNMHTLPTEHGTTIEAKYCDGSTVYVHLDGGNGWLDVNDTLVDATQIGSWRRIQQVNNDCEEPHG